MPTYYLYIDDKVSVPKKNLLPGSISYNSIQPKFHSLLARFTLVRTCQIFNDFLSQCLSTVKIEFIVYPAALIFSLLLLKLSSSLLLHKIIFKLLLFFSLSASIEGLSGSPLRTGIEKCCGLTTTPVAYTSCTVWDGSRWKNWE